MSIFGSELFDGGNEKHTPKRFTRHVRFYRDRDEFLLDSETYLKGNRMHFFSPFHSAIRKYLIEAIMHEEPDFYRGEKKIRIADGKFKDAFSAHWMPAMEESVGEAWSLGIVPIRAEEIEEGSWIPVVQRDAMGIDYEITAQRQRPSGRTKFRFYRTKLKNGDTPTNPIEDKRVVIFDGFGANPSRDGSLNSVTASLLNNERYFELNYDYNLKALHNMSSPPLVTETDNQAWGTSMGDDITETYAGQDAIDERKRAHFRANSSQQSELTAQARSQYETYLSRYQDEKNDPKRLGMPFHNNHFWLPAHHKLARQVAGQMRSDWDKFHQVHEDILAMAYGVPREHVFPSQSAKFQVNTVTADKKLVNVINRWRRDLGRVFTEFHARVYPDDADVTIRFPRLPFDTYESMAHKYSIGLLKYEGLKDAVKAITYLEDDKFNVKAAPPIMQAQVPSSSSSLVTTKGNGDRSQKSPTKRKRE